MEKVVFIHGPDPQLELAYSDVWLGGLYSRRVLVFELPAASSPQRVIEVVEKALKALVQGTPELGSVSVVVPDGKIPWSFAELQSQEYPLAFFQDDLLMPIPRRVEPAPSPQAKFQISLIKGGVLLSACLHHHLTDGNGMNTIIRAVSQACKQAASSAQELCPIVLNTDRTTMNSLEGGQTDLVYHPAHRIIPGACWPKSNNLPVPAEPSIPSMADNQQPDVTEPLQLPSPTSPPVSCPFIPAYFRLGSVGAIQLKADANPPGNLSSTHDAIVALLWRTITLARYRLGRVQRSDKMVYTFPVNARHYLDLPNDWIGNCVYFCAIEKPVFEFLTQETGSLSAIAGQIRKALDDISHERVKGIMTLRRSNPYDLAWWPTSKVNDATVLLTTSFYHSGMYANWGLALGPVRHFTTTISGAVAGGLERTSFVGPRLDGGKGCDVMVGADTEEISYFRSDDLWNRYFEPLKR